MDTKLQRASRDFLIRLIATHGLAGAARVLRALADELSRLAKSAGIKHERALPLCQRRSNSDPLWSEPLGLDTKVRDSGRLSSVVLLELLGTDISERTV
jgi:hypothetical protein